MTRRTSFPILFSSVSIALANTSCELINKFEGWTPPEGSVAGSAGRAGDPNSARGAGTAGIFDSSGMAGSRGSSEIESNLANAASAGAYYTPAAGAAAGSPGPGIATIGGAPVGGALGSAGTSSSFGTAGITGVFVGLGGTATAAQGGSTGAPANLGNAGAVAATSGVGTSGGSISIGSFNSGGATLGSTASGGSAIGGSATGGTTASGGAATGGTTTASGGSGTGGMTTASGGTATGGTSARGGSAAGGSAAGGAAAGGTTSACPGTGGPSMVKLPQGFCIDSTEVTRAQYTAWLNTITTATVQGQDQVACGWNARFAANAACMENSSVCQGTACGNHPQVCIDWCDAYAYCKGVGKRLCGKISGSENPYDEYANETMSQWFSACSSVGANLYPYGPNYVQPACNGLEFWTDTARGTPTTIEAGTLSTCQAIAPYNGVYDLSGNVQEWEDSCEDTTPGDSANCRVRGCYFGCTGRGLTCSQGNLTTRSTVDAYTGFRCCGP